VGALTAAALATHALTKHGLKVYALMAHQPARMICGLTADGPSVHGRAPMTDRATERSLVHDRVPRTRRATAGDREVYGQAMTMRHVTAEYSLAHGRAPMTRRATAGGR
jgi:hypothetical protein